MTHLNWYLVTDCEGARCPRGVALEELMDPKRPPWLPGLSLRMVVMLTGWWMREATVVAEPTVAACQRAFAPAATYPVDCQSLQIVLDMLDVGVGRDDEGGVH